MFTQFEFGNGNDLLVVVLVAWGDFSLFGFIKVVEFAPFFPCHGNIFGNENGRFTELRIIVGEMYSTQSNHAILENV